MSKMFEITEIRDANFNAHTVLDNLHSIKEYLSGLDESAPAPKRLLNGIKAKYRTKHESEGK